MPAKIKQACQTREEVTLMKGELSCYRNHQFNGGRMVILGRWPV